MAKATWVGVGTYYRDKAKGILTSQSVGPTKVSKVTDLFSRKDLPGKMNDNKTITVEQVDSGQNPYVTILQITLNENSYTC